LPVHLQADDSRARQSARAHLTPRSPPRAPHRQAPEYFAVYVEDDEGGEPEFICDLTASLPEQWQVPHALRPPPSARGTARAQRVALRTPLSKRLLPPAHLARPAQPITARTFLARGEDAFRRADEAVRPRQSLHAPGAAPARLAHRSSLPSVRRDPFQHLDPNPLFRQVREGRNIIALDDVLVLAPVVQPKQAAPGPGSAPLHVPARGHPARPRGARRVRETAHFGVPQVITVIHNYARSPAEAELYARARAELEQARPRARAAPRTGPGSRGPVA
jgi:hypothetical protein